MTGTKFWFRKYLLPTNITTQLKEKKKEYCAGKHKRGGSDATSSYSDSSSGDQQKKVGQDSFKSFVETADEKIRKEKERAAAAYCARDGQSPERHRKGGGASVDPDDLYEQMTIREIMLGQEQLASQIGVYVPSQS